MNFLWLSVNKYWKLFKIIYEYIQHIFAKFTWNLFYMNALNWKLVNKQKIGSVENVKSVKGPWYRY